jgi:predicted CXXCH cytochrome family protein
MRTSRTERPGRRAAPAGARAARWVASLALVAPVAAAAVAGPTGIANSPHDLGANSSAAVKASVETNTCKFCHTPHGAQSTQLLWNHSPTLATVFNWGNKAGSPVTATIAGTPLPTSLRPSSLRCLGCHDGSIALGDVSAGGPIAVPNVSGKVSGGKLVDPVKLVGAGGNLAGQHPFGIPYAGTGRTYNGITSAIPNERVTTAVKDSYWPLTTSGCGSPSGVCTVGTSALAGNVPGVNGAAIYLVPDSPGDTVNVGIECTTCHEPHNRWGFPKLMRVDTDSDALCISCHNQ